MFWKSRLKTKRAPLPKEAVFFLIKRATPWHDLDITERRGVLFEIAKRGKPQENNKSKLILLVNKILIKYYLKFVKK